MKKFVLALLLTVSIFTLAACGGSTDDTPDGDPGDTPIDDPGDDDPVVVEPSQGVTDTTVTVGNTAATSGALAAVGGPFKAGMDAYFGMINDAGGVAGRTIEYIQYDDEYNGALGLTYTQQLVEDDEVFALVGHFGTPTVAATQDYLAQVGIPTTYYASGISALFKPEATGGERASFPVQPIYDAEGEVMVARAISELGAQNIGVLYSNDDAGFALLNGIQLRASDLGITLAAVAQVSATADDMSTAAQIMLSSGVDVVIVAMTQVPAATAVRALVAAGNTVPVITSYVNADATWLAGVEDAIGNFEIYASAWINIMAENGVDFSEDYLLFSTTVPAEYAANSFAFAGWIAAATFVVGLERVGDEPLTWENYIDAMESEPVVLPFGVVVDYANGRRVGTQAMAFLQATSTDGVLAWETIKPIETINDIIEN